MREQGFWQENERYIDSMINTVNELAEDHYAVMRNLIHPEDLWEYEEAIPERVQGINLDRQLCVRMRDAFGEYRLFSFHTDIVTDEESGNQYLLILLHNEDVRAFMWSISPLSFQRPGASSARKLWSDGAWSLTESYRRADLLNGWRQIPPCMNWAILCWRPLCGRPWSCWRSCRSLC